MTVPELIELIKAKLNFLNSQKLGASSIGDIDRVIQIDNEIETSTATLNQLESLLG